MKKNYHFNLLPTLVLFIFIVGYTKAQPLPGTNLLTTPDGWDCAESNTRQITSFLDAKIAESEQRRARHWNRQFANRSDYEQSVEQNRERLRFILGVRDARKPFEAPEFVATLASPALIAETNTHKYYAIRWAVFESLSGEGILAEPKSGVIKSAVVHIPDVGITPEQAFGIATCPDWFPVVHPAADVRVVIPALVDRSLFQPKLPYREYIYRAAYQNGRHIIGYEVQETLALVDWLKRDASLPVAVEGIGEGGLLAMYAAAVDIRIDAAVVGGYFSNRDRVCEEPIDRNIFGLLDQFGDAEIATLIAPRTLSILDVAVPEYVMERIETVNYGALGCAPGRAVAPDVHTVRKEIERAKKLVEPFNLPENWITFIDRNNAVQQPSFSFIADKLPNQEERMLRIVDGMDRHTQELLAQAEFTRRAFWKPLDDIEDAGSPEFAAKIEWYRDYFATELIGRFDDPLAPPNPRTCKQDETDKYVVYEVELDVFNGVTVYGLLLIPKDLRDGEKRGVVVCQHGLEGRPRSAGFVKELCERGYITFAPQGIFTGGDKFRYNQRQLNSLGKTLFSIMVPQQQQLVNWLGTLPFVEKEKIAFYGISYGGKTAMRVPPLVKGYCLSICCADFNTWNIKNASTRYPFSYMWLPEYEIFEFDMANTFDYSEITRLIAPRPFMVERGYRDNVGWNEFVAFEYAKVHAYYAYRLEIPDRTEIHWFGGGHQINGEKTYPFLDRFLK